MSNRPAANITTGLQRTPQIINACCDGIFDSRIVAIYFCKRTKAALPGSSAAMPLSSGA
jgi:hypothetical protein